MKLLIVSILLITLCGCVSIQPWNGRPDEVEQFILKNTPYMADVFDCTERAAMAYAILSQEGYTVKTIYQRYPESYNKLHACLAWNDNKGQEGTILCMSGWRLFE